MITTITTTATNTPTLELLSLDEAIIVSEGEVKWEDVAIYIVLAVMIDVLVVVMEVETAVAIN